MATSDQRQRLEAREEFSELEREAIVFLPLRSGDKMAGLPS
jgi:hypothetical protein